MPNWTFNSVTCKGIGNNKNICKKGVLDFNKIIPEPKTKKECIEKYGELYIDKGDAHIQHNGDRNWFNWYTWRCKFWGTKWNACDFSRVSDDVIEFTTAWCEPEPIFEALSKMYPTETLSVEAEYEEVFFVTREYKNGKLIKYEETEDM